MTCPLCGCVVSRQDLQLAQLVIHRKCWERAKSDLIQRLTTQQRATTKTGDAR